MSAAGIVIVEQLNPSQWHADVPGRSGIGVGNYARVLSLALLFADACGFGVETIALDGTRLVLMREGVRHG